MEKTQIFRLGDRHVLTKSEHDEFTKQELPEANHRARRSAQGKT